MAHHITETIGDMYGEGSIGSKYDPQEKELPPLPGGDENATTTEEDVEGEDQAERRKSRRASQRVSYRKSYSNESAADSAAAAAVVQQEMNNVQTLKRLSMGALPTLDPDLPQMFWLDDSAGSPSSSSSSAGGENPPGGNEASQPTSPPPVPPKSPTGLSEGDRLEAGGHGDGSSPINATHASQLLWVPAHVHPEIAPQEWKSFVQNKVAEIKANVSSSPSTGSDLVHSGSLNRRNSRLSLEINNQDEYRDGSEILQRRTSQDSNQSISRLSAQLQTLGELESLAMDPFQLARSLSHSPMSSQAPPPSHTSENERPHSTPAIPANTTQPLANDADEPILAAPSSSLRRSTRTRYSKNSLRRGGRRLRLDTERASKEGGDDEDSAGMPRSRTSPELSRPLQDFSVTDEQEQHRPLRKASLDDDYPLRAENKPGDEQKQDLPPTSEDHPPPPEPQKEPPSLKEKAQQRAKEASAERKKSKRREKQKQPEIDSITPSTTIASVPPVPSTAPPPPPSSPPTAPPPPPPQPQPQQQQQQTTPPLVPSTGNKGASSVAKPTSPSLQVQQQQPPPPPPAPTPQQPKQTKPKAKKGTWGWLFSDKSKDSNEPTTNKPNTNANTNDMNGVPDTHDKVTVDKLLNRNATDDDSEGNSSPASSPSKATFSSLFTKKKNKKEATDTDTSDSKRKKKNKKPKSKKTASRYRTRQQLEGDDDFDDEDEEEDIGGEPVGGLEGLPPQHEQEMRQLQYEQQMQQQQQEIQLPYNIPPHQVSDKSMVMLYHRYPLHIERAIYRLSHLKLANPRRPLAQQVLLSNFMYAYLNLINHGYQQQQQLQQLQMQEEMSEMQMYQGQDQQDYEHEYEYDMEPEGQPFDPYASEHQSSAYDGHFGAQSPSAESSSSSSSSGGGSNYDDMWHGDEHDNDAQSHKKSYHRDPLYGVA
ncbi:hypothetical protein TRICI_005474 [Trichomonascus ciferrii]|uniref:Protein Zds1 C-terminal domain-containing protein n=1 Tax=Trichomonascus ciferrii TaxID=44093 RepID=A0A642USN5_9ASCO|nr:hypothetical protein TRICI_005474 [Trichomonascus ciferrii]